MVIDHNGRGIKSVIITINLIELLGKVYLEEHNVTRADLARALVLAT